MLTLNNQFFQSSLSIRTGNCTKTRWCQMILDIFNPFYMNELFYKEWIDFNFFYVPKFSKNLPQIAKTAKLLIILFILSLVLDKTEIIKKDNLFPLIRIYVPASKMNIRNLGFWLVSNPVLLFLSFYSSYFYQLSSDKRIQSIRFI